MITSSLRAPRARAMTLIELLVVLAILGLLTAILVPGLQKGKILATSMKNTSNLRQIAVATLTWANDNGGKLPSPEYPGGITVPSSSTEEDYFPDYWDVGETGLWLDGVVFAHMYIAEQARREEESENYEDTGGYASTGGYNFDENGSHLRTTLFENTRSVTTNPDEKDYHKHSYAMNANLQYDRIYDQVESSDPYLTEKTLSNLIHAPSAMLYIECSDPNVVRFDDREEIIETGKQRWGEKGKIIAAFLDGHAERISPDSIPDEDPEGQDRSSSRFWRGVDP
ncbi:MAG: type II secretion system protein [Verrucomicrobiota bacterium]